MSKSAEELKELGNKAFGAKDYETAIQHYSEAIRLDPKNHVFFSNRSASHAFLQQNEKAATDAKECIRLDPTFVKGYYRLVTAQIALKEYDGALATIRQGLAVDSTNAQLLKQQRMVQQLKRSQEATLKKRQEQASKAAAAAADSPVLSGAGGEFQELLTQFTQTKRDYESEKVNLVKVEREEKICTLTREEVEPLPDAQKCYRSVGKMFLLSPKPDVISYLDTSIADSKSKQEELKQKLSYLEKKMQSQQQNMQELQKQQAVSSE